MKRAKQRNPKNLWRNSTAAFTGQPMLWRQFSKKVTVKSVLKVPACTK